MTLRDDIRGLLEEPGAESAALLGDLPSELVSTLLTHFADTAPIEQADALAPLVMQASPVPFDEELDGVGSAPLDDPMSELGLLAVGAVAEVELVDHDTDSVDRDPDELDALADSVPDDQDGAAPHDGEAADDDFGSGSADITPEATTPSAEPETSADDFGYVDADADPMDFDALDMANSANDSVLESVDESGDSDADDDFDDMFD